MLEMFFETQCKSCGYYHEFLELRSCRVW